MCLTIWNHLSAQFRVICSIRIDRINRWDLIQQNTKTCESLTLFFVSCTAPICKVLASIQICSLRHCRRYSGWCFLHFHSTSPKNFKLVLSVGRGRHPYFLIENRNIDMLLSTTEDWIIWCVSIQTTEFNETLHKASDHMQRESK